MAARARENSEAGAPYESLKLKSGGRGRAEEEGAGAAERKMAVPGRGSAPGLGRRAGRQGWDDGINPFLPGPRPPPRPRAPGPEWKLPFPLEGGPARGPGEVGEFAGGGDPGSALPF